MTCLDRKLRRDLWHLRSQFGAVVLVVASGVALFVSLRSMHGYLLGAQAAYYQSHRFAQVFAHVKQAPRAIAGRIAALPGVAAVSTRVVADVLLDVPGLAEPATGRLVSLPEARLPGLPRLPILNDLHLKSGRYVAAGSSGEVIASDAFARANGLHLGDSIAAVIHGRWQRLRLVGTAISPEYIYEIRAGDIFPDNHRFGVLWMGDRALAAAFGLEGACNDVALTLAPGAVEAEVVARLDRLLAPYGSLGAYGREDHVSHRFLSDEIAETRVTSIVMPAIFLGVTAFLLHMVMTRLVGTQRDQVAVLKAFGYGNGAIGWHYLKLALVPLVAGSALGTGFGLWFASGLASVYARFFQFPDARFTPDPAVVVTAILVGAGAGVVGALGAVRRAVALPPAEAMRPDSPATFRRGVLERLGVGRLLSPAARITARHLERRPVKAALSVLGIAFATAILLVGRYGFDAIEWMKDAQFHHVQREDVAVAFTELRPAAVRDELAHLPGVLRVEPFRAVAVRLRHGPRVQRTALQGLDPDGRLRRIIDGDLVAHRPPPAGLLLTTHLARLLEVHPGERLTVEVLEGERPVREVEVAGTVDELIGTSAYMDIAALHRLLREGPVLSGAFLAVDPPRAAALYARLKRLPGVTGVGVVESALRGFERTIAESFTISLGSMIGFACVIAFGMVFNGARVALSERGRELASLRVLGFSRREVAGMLLGEQAVLTLLAIPLGFAIGLGFCAVVVFRFATELFRMPLVISGASLAFATVVTLAAAAVSAFVVRRRIDRLDLVEVLKTRE